ncbi:MAG: hypothetical protein CR988_06730 [Treponema sp.]|nr:MAG: hypothetical protein CR988_06730 [Treponema sp.]
MCKTVDWQDEKFSKCYDEEFSFLCRRMENDSSCTIEELEGILESLYVIDGNNVSGRSSVAQISLSASIAAYEAFIYKQKNKSGGMK